MESITLREEFIKLGQALKAAGLVESGVEPTFEFTKYKLTSSSSIARRESIINLGLNPIIMSFPVLRIETLEFMVPKLEFIFNSITLSKTFKIRQTLFSISVNDSNKMMTGELFQVADYELKVASRAIFPCSMISPSTFVSIPSSISLAVSLISLPEASPLY